MDAPNTPAAHPTTEITPSEAGAAAAASVVQAQQERAKSAWEEALDIKDPGQQPTTPAAAETETPALPTTKPIAGATVEAGLTPDLLSRAREAGIPEAEAKTYPAALLERAIERIEDSYYYDEPAGPQHQQQPPQVDPRYQAWLQQQQQAAQPSALDNALAAMKEKYEPELVSVFEQIHQSNQQAQAELRQKLEAAQEALQQTQNRSQAQEAARNAQTLDDLFAGDKDSAEVLGAGSIRDVGHREQQLRLEIVAEMEADIDRAVRQGRTAPALNQRLYERARDRVLGPRPQAQEQVIARARNRMGQFINTPTASRNGDLQPGIEKAVKSVDMFMREKGMR